jgi:hypothetical protein
MELRGHRRGLLTVGIKLVFAVEPLSMRGRGCASKLRYEGEVVSGHYNAKNVL